eukprot:329963-Chlamydomonas_euryale.AAC.3
MERVEREGEVATAFTLARLLSNVPLSRGGPTSLVIFDIHALQVWRVCRGREERLFRRPGQLLTDIHVLQGGQRYRRSGQPRHIWHPHSAGGACEEEVRVGQAWCDGGVGHVLGRWGRGVWTSQRGVEGSLPDALYLIHARCR